MNLFACHFACFQLANTDNPNDISLFEVLAHIRTQRHGLIQTPEQLRYKPSSSPPSPISSSSSFQVLLHRHSCWNERIG